MGMSVHSLERTVQGRPVLITTGWDRMLQTYHLTAEYLDTDKEDYLFEGFSEFRPGGMSLQRLEELNQELGLQFPEGLLGALQEDMQHDTGNSYRHWP